MQYVFSDELFEPHYQTRSKTVLKLPTELCKNFIVNVTQKYLRQLIRCKEIRKYFMYRLKLIVILKAMRMKRDSAIRYAFDTNVLKLSLIIVMITQFESVNGQAIVLSLNGKKCKGREEDYLQKGHFMKRMCGKMNVSD